MISFENDNLFSENKQDHVDRDQSRYFSEIAFVVEITIIVVQLSYVHCIPLMV